MLPLGARGTTDRNVNLRRDPSTASPVLDHLATGARVTLVDAAEDSGFFHVRTEDDLVGWVWSKYVTVSSTASPLFAARIPTVPPSRCATRCCGTTFIIHSG